ncbi:hypothetical protein KFL_000200135 [Klebsormidium nitens]|uniref:Dirigent protein n=1 Tax=Klebsormidium nitens TaxID=105231 RepID=A0A1Y1HPF5_KLENI|nr:hypothetical protein KFL_000200135 [Klebsormidium nitens]|eukprot:GAQ78861.1 hypothetical protein KFL_000200135 [Klebsormidium nitens]
MALASSLKLAFVFACTFLWVISSGTVSAEGKCASAGICGEGVCAASLNYCYSNGTQQLTCCTSTCDNCDLSTGQPPSAFQTIELFTQRPQIPGPRHSVINTSDIEGGFSFSEDFFLSDKLPADLNNPVSGESAGSVLLQRRREPGGISSGTGRFRLARGEAIFTRSIVSSSGNHTYDGVKLYYALS